MNVQAESRRNVVLTQWQIRRYLAEPDLDNANVGNKSMIFHGICLYWHVPFYFAKGEMIYGNSSDKAEKQY